MENKGLKIIIGVLAIVLIISFISNSKTDLQNSPPTGQATGQPTRIQVSADDDDFLGDANAPVTIIEFSDYECPFCGRFYTDALQQIKEKYVETGKVKFVYRDFPLSFHTNAQKAAESAECAGDQEKYYEMHNMLFESGVTGGITSFKQYAANLGLNQNEFDVCLDSGKYYDEIQNDIKDGSAAGVRGTPATFVNGILVSGAQPFSVFEQIIEAELAS
ncbi:DsbA family protein [Candidatus Woesearchaeota archaeon]|jgi:protein-disulfide isomerase|nr:DsbA family protein [Candidatus Woesearchaeota archaeon]